jgi:hypothetical protein
MWLIIAFLWLSNSCSALLPKAGGSAAWTKRWSNVTPVAVKGQTGIRRRPRLPNEPFELTAQIQLSPTIAQGPLAAFF